MDHYLKVGFSKCDDKDCPIPLCGVCSEVVEIVACQMKPHTIAKSLLPECCMKVRKVLGDELEQEIANILLSIHTIYRTRFVMSCTGRCCR